MLDNCWLPARPRTLEGVEQKIEQNTHQERARVRPPPITLAPGRGVLSCLTCMALQCEVSASVNHPAGPVQRATDLATSFEGLKPVWARPVPIFAQLMQYAIVCFRLFYPVEMRCEHFHERGAGEQAVAASLVLWPNALDAQLQRHLQRCLVLSRHLELVPQEHATAAVITMVWQH